MDHTLEVWDLSTSAVLAAFAADAYANACAVAPDGVIITSGDPLGRVHFLRLENGGGCSSVEANMTGRIDARTRS
jgi:hypothetical protein